MDKLRLRFRKIKRAVYISHLDLMHTFQRAFSRAGYELKYSEGYNPHPQISIALPLSVGVSSLCEIMDFKMKEDVDLNKLPDRLNSVMPEGIEVIEAYEAQNKVKGLKWLEISGMFDYDNRDPETMKPALDDFYSQDEIVISKKTKRGIGETDIRPSVRNIDFKAVPGGVELHAMISAQEPTLNPELLADALRQKKPEIAPDFAEFVRIETFSADGDIFR
ncbi:MAG: TIGR03936 family radical SAM-associated protein [Candidatus Limivicinus sp.]|jgi:radical SAM-linked protein